MPTLRAQGVLRSWVSRVSFLAAAAVLAAAVQSATADEPIPGKNKPAVVELFEAQQTGEIGIKVVVRDQHHARVIVTNQTKVPLSIELPAVLAARPVLAQGFFGNGSTPGAFNGQQSGGASAPQAIGGPSSTSIFANAGQNQNNGGAVFNIPPESVRALRLDCFCLEHGKPNPRSVHDYELVPLAEVNDDPALAEVLVRFGRGDVDRDATQAAVWHTANGKTWQELAAMSRMVALNASAPIFTRRQLDLAKQLASQAEKSAATKTAAAKSAAAGKSDAPVVEGTRLDATNLVDPAEVTTARQSSRSIVPRTTVRSSRP